MNVHQAIESFLHHGQNEKNLSDRTLRAYQSDLTQFDAHVSGAEMVNITYGDLEGYVSKLGTGPYRETSIRRKVAALKVFFRFLEEKGHLPESPARRLKIRQPIEERVPNIMSTREIRQLLLAPKREIEQLMVHRDDTAGSRNRYFCAVRDNVIIELLFSTGIRIGELVALSLSDIDLGARQLKITGRGTRGRVVELTSPLVTQAFSSYMEMRSERPLEHDAVFVGRAGTRLTIYSIENIFKKYVRNAEIKRHITPHALRHTMAATLVNSGTNLREVQEMLGHASILSTQVYTRLSIGKNRRPAVSATGDVEPRLTIKK